ncbi:MAG: NUDIX hydrolase [Spongiibacteraceae bacterium]|nr:NUDIX hydrolase [Spongiibacteraceae bacterium]
MPLSTSWIPEWPVPDKTKIRPAATLVLLRESADGLEALLLRRHSASRVGSGAWVFPGGVVEEEDYRGGDDIEAAARCAAVRETTEEASITVPLDSLRLISHWTTPDAPEVSKKRFATWFFLSVEPVDEIVVDGEEIDAYAWYSPAQAIADHQSGVLKLMPPTLVTLTELQHCKTLADAQAFYAQRSAPYINPRMAMQGEKICMLYEGDAGYENTDSAAEGLRNRCWLEGSYWRYEFLN